MGENVAMDRGRGYHELLRPRSSDGLSTEAPKLRKMRQETRAAITGDCNTCAVLSSLRNTWMFSGSIGAQEHSPASIG